ncbi:hypothetical protein [Chryseolinea sp. H1M3-3]|uniref:c-type cytochrome n=1 Tax=Chryseolinea sp. H1M3-3 TaxID=3034144 RepID=UPI0023EAE965|nr:hypothetical protein [Chryseolinea sp. H1M3-3]
MKIKMLACAVCLGTIAFQSCVEHDLPEPEIETCSVTISFTSQVKPIINTNCAVSGCHNGDLGADKNWTVFSTLQGKIANVKDRINRPPGTPGHMPAFGSLTQDEITTISCWVDQGGQNN